MRTCFGKRSVLLPAGAIGGAGSANAVQAILAGLAEPISSMAAAKGTTAGTSTLALVKGTLEAM